jgi:hypothetical protein
MRKIFAAILFALAVLVSASIADAQVPVFKCYASSWYAYGYGWAASPQSACAIALRECAMRAPVGDICYARYWVREQ